MSISLSKTFNFSIQAGWAVRVAGCMVSVSPSLVVSLALMVPFTFSLVGISGRRENNNENKNLKYGIVC